MNDTELLAEAHAMGIPSSWAHHVLSSKGAEALAALIRRQQAPAQPTPLLPLELPTEIAPTPEPEN